MKIIYNVVLVYVLHLVIIISLIENIKTAKHTSNHPSALEVSLLHCFNSFIIFPIKFQLKYPAPGAPELATKVKELLAASDFNCVHEDKKRGLDHGAWVPLMLMYPEADIPVCQLSVQAKEDGIYHYNLGRALAPLKNEGVLIIGSGSATHNLRALKKSSDNLVAPWALQFDTWLKESLLSGR